MSTSPSGWSNAALNVALVALGVLVLVLLYSFVSRSVLPRTDATREANPTDLVGDVMQVEVRNGCGVEGLAARMRHFLQRNGFDVVEVGDHTTFDEPRTLVIDRVGDLEAARKLARALGVPEGQVVQEIRTDYYLDASVIIGHDYQTLPPFDTP
jgi:hypothetical protein